MPNFRYRLLALSAALAGASAARAADPQPKPDDPAAEASAVTAQLEDIDARVQKGLAELTDAMRGFDAERKAWTALDRSVSSARAVNKALGDRNRLVLKLYDANVSKSLAEFAEKLKAAPAVYRRMAVIRRGQLAAAATDFERRSYQAMVDLSESAATLCEQRHAELFGDTPAAAGKPRAVNASGVAEKIAAMRKLLVVHDHYEETFAAFPSALANGDLAALFDHLTVYVEDLEAFTKGVETLNATLRKQGGAGPQANRPGAGTPRPNATDPVMDGTDRSDLVGSGRATRELSANELLERIRSARLALPAQYVRGTRVYPTVRQVERLPADPDPNTVYVVGGVEPWDRKPVNVVYTVVERARPGLIGERPLLAERSVPR